MIQNKMSELNCFYSNLVIVCTSFIFSKFGFERGVRNVKSENKLLNLIYLLRQCLIAYK